MKTVEAPCSRQGRKFACPTYSVYHAKHSVADTSRVNLTRFAYLSQNVLPGGLRSMLLVVNQLACFAGGS
jgi:hypothetical protein